ncbi:interleukin-1 receptor-associated kinase 4-like [Ornithodoros turicata]|uniref:interleukin-1 receptor-associated kinase 4-like n=1 Tax=Ornithodoros turicata TaxID=34597 RepID=UPI0031390946
MAEGGYRLPVTKDTELRFLENPARLKLTNVLDVSGAWKQLMHMITHPDHPGSLLFTADHVRLLENETRRSPTDEMLKTWSTTGRNRPRISDLLRLLKDAELNRAASIISLEVLKEQTIDNGDDDECIAVEDFEVEPTAPPLSEPLNGNVSDMDIPVFEYRHLVQATRNFCNIPWNQGGCKLGEGAFGVVYKGTLEDGSVVAVKCLKEYFPDHFLTEVELLRRHAHPNLLPLLGIGRSVNGHCCIVYQFMQMGSLQSCIARENNTPAIDWKKRFSILKDVAAGINFLHTRTPKAFIHRDIKSANVLLDNDLTAKLGDFGLLRVLSGNNTTRTDVVVGTTIYMAPETFLGKLSPEMDTYSFGVVIMEVLTGLAPYDNNRVRGKDILSYLEEVYDDDEMPVPDGSAGYWDLELAQHLHDIGKHCINPEKKRRPTMQMVYDRIVELNNALPTAPI